MWPTYAEPEVCVILYRHRASKAHNTPGQKLDPPNGGGRAGQGGGGEGEGGGGEGVDARLEFLVAGWSGWTRPPRGSP